MGTRNHGNVVSLLLLILFSLPVSKCSSLWPLWGLVTLSVKVQNDIEGYGVSLNMHCRSNDDDLGLRTLHKGDEWHWQFKQSLIRNTHFWCHFRWYDNGDHRWYEGTFEVYDGIPLVNKYYKVCKNNCDYSVRRDGVYLYRRDTHEWARRGTWH
ncbi:hypothetical protein MKX03_024802 [Papaver bracteatum]|nr:hypothetical protein MKX03_024802 [Papaver bracteatum]